MQSSQFEQFLSAYKVNWAIAKDDLEGWRRALTTIPFSDSMAAIDAIQEKRIKSGKTDKWAGPKILEIKAAIQKREEKPGCVVNARTTITTPEQARVDEDGRCRELAAEWLDKHPGVYPEFRDYLRRQPFGKHMVDMFDKNEDYSVVILASAVGFMKKLTRRK